MGCWSTVLSSPKKSTRGKSGKIMFHMEFHIVLRTSIIGNLIFGNCLVIRKTQGTLLSWDLVVKFCSRKNVKELMLSFFYYFTFCRMAPIDSCFECLANRKWHYYKVWPCWRNCATVGVGFEDVLKLYPVCDTVHFLLPAAPVGELSATSPASYLPVCCPASCMRILD